MIDFFWIKELHIRKPSKTKYLTVDLGLDESRAGLLLLWWWPLLWCILELLVLKLSSTSSSSYSLSPIPSWLSLISSSLISSSELTSLDLECPPLLLLAGILRLSPDRFRFDLSRLWCIWAISVCRLSLLSSSLSPSKYLTSRIQLQ